MSYFGSNSQFSSVNKDAVKSSTVSVVKPSSSIKSIVNKSPFTYGAKKITFSVKPRTRFWSPFLKEDFETATKKMYTRKVINSLLSGEEFSIESILNKPVSPVLALTLILLNKEVFKSKIFDDYGGDPNASVSNMFTPTVYAKSTSTVNDANTEVVYGSTETYKKSLPPYYHIHGAYVNYGAPTDTNKGTNSVYMNDGGNLNLNGEQLRALNYLRKEGVLKKIADLPYGVKSSDINILRDGYGYGAICIGTFLNILKSNKKVIPDVICGLLVSEDSGMTLKDAKKGIEEWLNPGHSGSGLLEFTPLMKMGTYQVLETIEEIGNYFFLSLLGHTFKKNVHFSIPMTSSQRNIFEAGYLLGDAMNDLRQYAKTIISQGLYKQKTFEVFSIYTPCVMTSDGQVSDSVLEMGNYSSSFGDLTTMEDNPLTQVLGVKKCIDDIEDLDYLINPINGYKSHDFINKNLADHYVNQLCKIFAASDYEDSDNYELIQSVTKKLIQDYILIDQGIAPRTLDNAKTYIIDHSKCHPIFENMVYNESIAQPFKIIGNGTQQTNMVFTTHESSTKQTNLGDMIVTAFNTNYPDGTVTGSTGSITISYNSDITTTLITKDLDLSDSQKKLLNKYLRDNTSLILSFTYASSQFNLSSITVKVLNTQIVYNNRISVLLIPDFELSLTGNLKLQYDTNTWKIIAPTGGTDDVSFKGTVLTDVDCTIVSLENNVNSLIKFKTMKLLKDNNCTLETYLYNINSVDDGKDKANAITTLFDVYGLAVCRIILINSLCNSYSLSLAASNDRYRKFFNVFTGFIEDMIDISVTNLK